MRFYAGLIIILLIFMPQQNYSVQDCPDDSIKIVNKSGKTLYIKHTFPFMVLFNQKHERVLEPDQCCCISPKLGKLAVYEMVPIPVIEHYGFAFDVPILRRKNKSTYTVLLLPSFARKVELYQVTFRVLSDRSELL